MQKVFYSPGPYCNTDTYEVIDVTGWTDNDFNEIGYTMAVMHYENYADYEDDDIEPEYDFCWYDMTDPEVAGRI